MAAQPVAFATKDNAGSTKPQLNAGISAADVSIALKTGNGALLPQPYSGTASSVGTATTLNSTGILAAIGGSAPAGTWIWNKTDGSVAIILSGATNSLTTTRLIGGTTNLWNNGDRWCIDPFVATFAQIDSTTQEFTQYEEALIIGRSTDTLTVASGGRGYNGTVANTFDADDYVLLLVTSPIVERLKDIISVMAQQQDSDRTTLATAQTNIGTLQDATYHYVVTTGSANAYVAATPALASYTAGNLVVFKANFTNTGSATLNLNGLGAKTIKKNDGATNLSASDIISGQIVVVRYDGTNFQMLSPVGTPATITYYNKTVYVGKGASSAVGGTTDANFDTHTYTIPANDLVDGVAYEFTGFLFLGPSGIHTVSVKLGSTTITSAAVSPGPANQGAAFGGTIFGTAAAGASVAVNGMMWLGSQGNVFSGSPTSSSPPTANVATNGTLTLQFSVAKGSNGNDYLMGVVIKKVSTSAFA